MVTSTGGRGPTGRSARTESWPGAGAATAGDDSAAVWEADGASEIESSEPAPVSERLESAMLVLGRARAGELVSVVVLP